MHQYIDGKSVYVVEFDTMPEMPITGLTLGEEAYDRILRQGPQAAQVAGLNRITRTLFGNTTLSLRERTTYAQALTHAIETGIVKEPGKYAIHLIHNENRYEIYKVNE